MGEPVVYASEEAAFSSLLGDIEKAEQAGDYDARNRMIFEAMLFYASSLQFKCGFRFDPSEPEWPVAFIELPTGQVSWHIKGHDVPWDGHTTDEKWARVHAWTEANPPKISENDYTPNPEPPCSMWNYAVDCTPDHKSVVLAWVDGPEQPGPCIAMWNAEFERWEMQTTMDWRDGMWSPMDANVTFWAELPQVAKIRAALDGGE
jgi:hypothetical protein